MRRSTAFVLGILGLLLLSGCFKADMDLEVTEDDLVSGTMLIALDEELAAMADEGDDVLPDPDDLPEGARVEEYAEDGMVGQRVTFSDVPLAEFDAQLQEDVEEGSAWSLTRDGDQFVFDASFSADEMAADADDSPTGENAEFEKQMQAMMEQMLSTAEFRVAITFPGEVEETNGELEGTTVTWDLDITKGADMHAVAAADSGGALEDLSAAAGGGDGGFPTVPVIVGAVALLGAAAAGWLLLRRRRGAPTG